MYFIFFFTNAPQNQILLIFVKLLKFFISWYFIFFAEFKEDLLIKILIPIPTAYRYLADFFVEIYNLILI